MLQNRLWVMFFCTASLIACGVSARAEESHVKMMSFNIRLGSAHDGENSWPHRRELLTNTILAYDPDLIGLQEAERMQLDHLLETLPQYVSIGVGRDSNGGGEYSALLIRRLRFDVASAGTFWLSDTPSEPGSKGWGNGPPRICTWARVFDRETERRFYVFNTHWDHRSQPSRQRSAALIAERIASREVLADPYVVMGDFNAGEQNPARTLLAESGPKDAFRVLYPDATEVGTFNGFAGTSNGQKIDAVLVSRHWNVQKATIDRTEREGKLPSDHFPVTATLELESP